MALGGTATYFMKYDYQKKHPSAFGTPNVESMANCGNA
jgi:hypothetical protein